MFQLDFTFECILSTLSSRQNAFGFVACMYKTFWKNLCSIYI